MPADEATSFPGSLILPSREEPGDGVTHEEARAQITSSRECRLAEFTKRKTKGSRSTAGRK